MFLIYPRGMAGDPCHGMIPCSIACTRRLMPGVSTGFMFHNKELNTIYILGDLRRSCKSFDARWTRCSSSGHTTVLLRCTYSRGE